MENKWINVEKSFIWETKLHAIQSNNIDNIQFYSNRP